MSIFTDVSICTLRRTAMQQVSSIYWDVAKSQVSKFFPTISPYRNSPFPINAVEKLVKIEDPMVAGITSIIRSLMKIGIVSPDNLTEIIIHDNTPVKSCKDLHDQIDRKSIPDEEKGEIIFKAIAAVHQQRVSSNSVGRKFFDTAPYDRYIYLPIEMIGFRNALEDYSFIKRITEILALRPNNDYYIEEAYKLAKLDFKEKYVIFPPTLDTIQRAILCLPPYINPEIHHAFEQNDKLLRIVAQHALKHF